MQISEINVYPVKSLRGIALKEAIVEERGFRNDRRWMLVDGAGRFLTQRERPEMALVTVAVGTDGLVFKRGSSEICVPLVPGDRKAFVEVWGSHVEALEYDDEVSRWFSDAIWVGCRLVRMPDEARRKVNPEYAVRPGEDVVSFADGYPYLLIGEGSLEDLNERIAEEHAPSPSRFRPEEDLPQGGSLRDLPPRPAATPPIQEGSSLEPLPMKRFRPNLVVEGSGPFEEDSWKQIKIGETVFHVVKPCGRCVITTIDPERGEFDGKEPLRTLATYRKVGNNVMFGQNLIAEKPGGTIRIGDEVQILETKD
jgi:uncharacterized protein